MEVRLSVYMFIEILETFEDILYKKIKQNLLFIVNENKSAVEENLLLSARDDLGLDIIKLLKNEDKPAIIGHITAKSELVYLNRQNVTRFEIITKQNKFYELLKIFSTSLLESIKCRIVTIENKKNKLKECDSNSNLFLLNFHNKFEFEQFIKKNLECDKMNLMKEKEILKFLKELYILLRKSREQLRDESNIKENSPLARKIALELEERVYLGFYYVGKRNYYDEDFELHRAVFENNLRLIHKICTLETTSHLYSEINEIDSNGNTPLMLAIKLENYDAITVLIDHEADIKHKSFEEDLSPMEFAIGLQNKRILKLLVNGLKKQKLNHWESTKSDVLKSIKSIPDFSLELKLNFDSNIFSLFSSITPNDHYKFSKSGGNVRIDMNISAINSSFKSMKGKCSILIQEKGNKFNIYKIDHEKKISYDYIDYLTNLADEDKKVGKLVEEGHYSNKIYTKDISLKQEKMKKEEKMGNFITNKYTAKGSLYIVKEKINKSNLKLKLEADKDYKMRFHSFSEYFKSGVENRKIFKEFQGLKNWNVDCNEEENYREGDDDNDQTSSYKMGLFNGVGIGKYNKNQNKKSKMASTGKIQNVKNRRGSGVSNKPKGYMLTDNVNNSDSESEYEIEYIEKLKKKKNIKIHKKPIEMSVWLSEHFPLKLSHFIPLFHILSFTSTEFSQLKSTICSNFLPFESFPLKISFPLGLSFYALLQVTSFSSIPPSNSTFELNYIQGNDLLDQSFSNKSHTGINNKIIQNNPVNLDEKYAKDFYERYYLEKRQQKNKKGSKGNDESDNDSIMDEKIREIFLNNDDDNVKPPFPKRILLKKEDKIYNSISISPRNNNSGNSLNPLNFLQTNANAVYENTNNGFFNGQLELENGGYNSSRDNILKIEDEDNLSKGWKEDNFCIKKTINFSLSHQNSQKKKNLDKTEILLNEDKEKAYVISALNEVKNSIKEKPPKHKNVSNKLSSPKSSNPHQEFLENEEEIPNEKHIFHKEKFVVKVPFTPTSRIEGVKKIQNKANQSFEKVLELQSHWKDEESHRNSDGSQKTIKCTFKPKLMKNYKNFFKYKSNIDVEVTRAKNKHKSVSPIKIDKDLIEKTVKNKEKTTVKENKIESIEKKSHTGPNNSNLQHGNNKNPPKEMCLLI